MLTGLLSPVDWPLAPLYSPSYQALPPSLPRERTQNEIISFRSSQFYELLECRTLGMLFIAVYLPLDMYQSYSKMISNEKLPN